MDRKKPARKCPLYLHRNGQWAKRINGKIRYFGTDQAEAVKLWSEHSTRIRNGQLPRSGDHSPTLAELGNVYAEHRKRDIKTGEFAERSYHEMLKTIERLIKWIGRDSQPSTLGPNDFFAIKEKMFEPVIKTRFARGKNHGRKTKRRSVVTVDGDIRRIRAFFGWCVANRYLQRAPDYGAAFKLASAKVLRKERAKSKRHLFSADEIRKILDQAKPDFRPIILFGINAGVGAGDLGYWELSQLPDLDQADVWVDLPRRKTGIDRRFLLWPETVSALKSYLEKRNPQRDGSSVVFVTRSRRKWYRENGASKQDSIGQAFIAARKRAGLKRGTFYDLRRTFRTIAGNSLDIEAVMHIMGHVAPETDMSARYRLAIPAARARRQRPAYHRPPSLLRVVSLRPEQVHKSPIRLLAPPCRGRLQQGQVLFQAQSEEHSRYCDVDPVAFVSLSCCNHPHWSYPEKIDSESLLIKGQSIPLVNPSEFTNKGRSGSAFLCAIVGRLEGERPTNGSDEGRNQLHSVNSGS